ncbi:GntR family transcriptional regulator [Amycolatopsis balhimycina DSM 5908]|uniref:GntR family transcriptional regulator n=1 Tax=Amycolatopsis balhimycina DSM 5908 TaxID=1081091 RepID=A0A428X5U6_AMYBA|nr:GntR family transcriptional regulator [Amycolatopsis balhimycina]RSM50698.1 GntR family transcriptional regulator [Amycolatopsis balhimycina DSM 5908]
MLISLDLSGDVPIYQQLRDRIVEGIAAGTLADGESLPSTRQLAADFGINFHTVNKAYDLLRQQGFVRLNRKSGAVVGPTPADDAFAAGWSGRARTVLAEAVAKGLPAAEVLATCRALLGDFEKQGDESS